MTIIEFLKNKVLGKTELTQEDVENIKTLLEEAQGDQINAGDDKGNSALDICIEKIKELEIAKRFAPMKEYINKPTESYKAAIEESERNIRYFDQEIERLRDKRKLPDSSFKYPSIKSNDISQNTPEGSDTEGVENSINNKKMQVDGNDNINIDSSQDQIDKYLEVINLLLEKGVNVFKEKNAESILKHVIKNAAEHSEFKILKSLLEKSPYPSIINVDKALELANDYPDVQGFLQNYYNAKIEFADVELSSIDKKNTTISSINVRDDFVLETSENIQNSNQNKKDNTKKLKQFLKNNFIIHDRHFEELKGLLSVENINEYYGEGMDKSTLLHKAVRGNALKCVKLLLEKNADVTIKDDMDRIPLYYTISLTDFTTNLEMFKLLLDKKPSMIEEKSQSGASWLQISVRSGNFEISRHLLENYKDSFNIEEKDAQENTLLHLAAQSGNLELFKYLEKECPIIDINQANKNEDTVLHLALQSGNLDIFKYLLNEKKIDINQVNKDGNTIFHLTLMPDYIRKISKKNRKESIELLLRNNANINAKNNNGDTLLHLAAQSGNLELFKYLIEKEAELSPNFDIKTTNNNGDTLLHIVINSRKPNLDIISYLLETNPTIINKKNTQQKTPLECYIEKCKSNNKFNDSELKVINLLLEKGATINEANVKFFIDKIFYRIPNNQSSPYDIMIYNKGGYLNLLKTLFEKKLVKDTSEVLFQNNINKVIKIAIKLQKFDLVKEIILNLDINNTKNIEISELLEIAINGSNSYYYRSYISSDRERSGQYSQIVCLLIQKYCLLDNSKIISHHSKFIKDNQSTILEIIIRNTEVESNIDILKQFLEKYPELVNKALKLAAKYNHKNGAKYLIEELKADGNHFESKDNSDTALDIAILHQSYEIAKFLLEKGAKISNKNAFSSLIKKLIDKNDHFYIKEMPELERAENIVFIIKTLASQENCKIFSEYNEVFKEYIANTENAVTAKENTELNDEQKNKIQESLLKLKTIIHIIEKQDKNIFSRIFNWIVKKFSGSKNPTKTPTLKEEKGSGGFFTFMESRIASRLGDEKIFERKLKKERDRQDNSQQGKSK